MDTKIVLHCKRITFYSFNDEITFFNRIKKIEPIVSFTRGKQGLFLYLNNNKLSRSDFKELFSLFVRYRINMKQLEVFRNKDNEYIFKYIYKKNRNAKNE